MLSEQVKQLREYADHLRTWKNIPLETNKTLLNQAADTIDELSAKLAAANMERSEAYYGSRSKYQDDADYLHDMLAEGVTVGDRAVSLDDEDKAVIRRAIGALEKVANMERCGEWVLCSSGKTPDSKSTVLIQLKSNGHGVMGDDGETFDISYVRRGNKWISFNGTYRHEDVFAWKPIRACGTSETANMERSERYQHHGGLDE